jgi:putative ubiquitin-RnfH superfamily antitoxin RatB of RatAB toxin-antitoxin module
MADGISVEVALATPERQVLLALRVRKGASVAEVITASGIASLFPDLPLDDMAAGIWGRTVSRDSKVREGDRVEIYRPLLTDPREARRRRALAAEG